MKIYGTDKLSADDNYHTTSESVTKIRQPFIWFTVRGNGWLPILLPELHSFRSLDRVLFTWMLTGLLDGPISKTWSILVVTWLILPNQSAVALFKLARNINSQLWVENRWLLALYSPGFLKAHHKASNQQIKTRILSSHLWTWFTSLFIHWTW